MSFKTSLKYHLLDEPTQTILFKIAKTSSPQQFPSPPAELVLLLFLLFTYSVSLGAVRRPWRLRSGWIGPEPGLASVWMLMTYRDSGKVIIVEASAVRGYCGQAWGRSQCPRPRLPSLASTPSHQKHLSFGDV